MTKQVRRVVESKDQPETFPVYLIVLTGQGDTYIKVVERSVFQWLHKIPKNKTDSSWLDEDVPERIQDTLAVTGRTGIRLTSGSWENDRALHAISVPPYTTYYTLLSAYKAIDRHRGRIVREYHGQVY
ncbi:MAG: hypothetical protein IPO08_23630 [Xanthomonadales bacterium]|nr:hypothetical protein [Xanthomonadales bacterium]